MSKINKNEALDDFEKISEENGELNYKAEAGQSYEEMYHDGYLDWLNGYCRKYGIAEIRKEDIDWEWANEVQNKQHELETELRRIILDEQLTFRKLVNSSILNDEQMVGFQGDSEYTNAKGRLVMGTWTYCDVMDNYPVSDSDWDLDSVISEEIFHDNITYYLVRNDNGNMCEIRLQYNHR